VHADCELKRRKYQYLEEAEGGFIFENSAQLSSKQNHLRLLKVAV
jgi:hypothetical protein